MRLWSNYTEIDEELKIVEDYVRKNTHSRNRLLEEVTADLVQAGGKRLRPAFTIIASKFGNYNREKTISIAAALEVLHSATLVHDDIVDRSKLRRGKITVSEKYGADMAVYTGDFLFTKAVLMLSKNIDIDKLEKVAIAIKAICEGEVDQFECTFNLNTSVMSYLKRINRKTAVLFAAACGLGAMVSDCPLGVSRDLAKYGLCYGMAFQIRDDLNDFLSDTDTSGKPVGNDLIKGTVTLPVIYAMNRNAAIKESISELFKKNGRSTPDEIAHITGLIEDSESIEYSKRILNKYTDRGLKTLKRLPDNYYRSILTELITALRY